MAETLPAIVARAQEALRRIRSFLLRSGCCCRVYTSELRTSLVSDPMRALEEEGVEELITNLVSDPMGFGNCSGGGDGDMQSSGNLQQGNRRRESRQTVPRSVEFAGLGKPRRLPGEVLGSGRRGQRRQGIHIGNNYLMKMNNLFGWGKYGVKSPEGRIGTVWNIYDVSAGEAVVDYVAAEARAKETT
ncbi:hypothetical protein LINGRAHAP2_LOCUS9295 [Linum grandiflorum]